MCSESGELTLKDLDNHKYWAKPPVLENTCGNYTLEPDYELDLTYKSSATFWATVSYYSWEGDEVWKYSLTYSEEMDYFAGQGCRMTGKSDQELLLQSSLLYVYLSDHVPC